jgi:hypothetical protein
MDLWDGLVAKLVVPLDSNYKIPMAFFEKNLESIDENMQVFESSSQSSDNRGSIDQHSPTSTPPVDDTIRSRHILYRAS